MGPSCDTKVGKFVHLCTRNSIVSLVTYHDIKFA